MKARRAAPQKTLTLLVALFITITIALPFHALLTVWLASFTGHYLVLRLWKEFLLVIALVGAGFVLVRNRDLRCQFLGAQLTMLIGAYSGLTLVIGLISWLTGQVTSKALAYGIVVNLRFLAWFLIVWVIAKQRVWLQKRWRGVVFWPALVVCAVGLLQFFVLPYDFMQHFGYNKSTIYPYETINHNLQYLRVMATLRGANPLGAYLVVVLALLGANWKLWSRAGRLALAAAASLTLLLTFSRAAWLGAVVSGVVLGLVGFQHSRHRKLVYYGLGGLLILVVLVFAGLRHNTALQNAVFHTDDKSTIAISSNQGHSAALKGGVRDIVHQPLGRGPGTAGPASVYNQGKVRIAENYYLQIGQEIGWLGLLLFLAINAQVLRSLWRIRENPLAAGLFAAGMGLIVVNLLSHAWTDDTLAYIWWGLAGVALAGSRKDQAERQTE